MSAAIPEGSVIITPTEMYREMLATHQAVRDVSGKLDGALDAHARRLDGVDKDLGDHEGRLRLVEQQVAPMADHEGRLSGVEKKVWSAAGASAVVAAGISAAATLLAVKH